MKIIIDRKMIDNLNEMSDEKLWNMMCILVSSSGLSSSSGSNRKKYDYQRIKGIRAVLENATDADIERINQLVEIYKSAKKQ